MGDFYELFLDDALIGARVLNITLTKRPRGKDGDIPMAGVPYHAADAYIAKLVRAGHKVAICEQISEPNARGIVERESERILKEHFGVRTLRGFGIAGQPLALKAACTLFGYLAHTQRSHVGHITNLRTVAASEHVSLDASTISNLELFKTIREGDEKGSFVDILDETQTAMGGRLLRRWIREPLRNSRQIEERLTAVEAFRIHRGGRGVREAARRELANMYDIERILSRLSVGIGNPHDLMNLKDTLRLVGNVAETIQDVHTTMAQGLREDIPVLEEVSKRIEHSLTQHQPLDAKKGGVINAGVNQELDQFREGIKDSQIWIAELEATERQRTGIGSLKVRFNQVFGYYIEISKSNLHLVPADYIRKQTMVNGERFITAELKEYEDKVLRGQEVIEKLEYTLFLELVATVLASTNLLQKIAYDTAVFDCILCFAHIAEREHYVRPELITTGEIVIEDGRHPVVERNTDISFVPNDTRLNATDHQLLVITGPNMAGKSVLMRQVALIVLMAHIGSFVPARRARISLIDRLFVRSGASDSIGRGLSTFMVEMVETAYILHHATKDSLVIMDEIGRGTSTYDGISIAWAVAEYLVTHSEHAAKTLFATHYHELQKLEEQFPEQIKNYHMAVESNGQNPIFLYRFVKGGAVGSYAIAVARLAGVPQIVTERAAELLSEFNHKE